MDVITVRIHALAQNLTSIRLARGLSIESLAQLARLSSHLIEGLERGDSAAMDDLDLVQFFRLAQAVKCEPEALLEPVPA